MKLFKRKKNNKQVGWIDTADLKNMMLDDKCNRIAVWSDDAKRYKRFDFVGWCDKDEVSE